MSVRTDNYGLIASCDISPLHETRFRKEGLLPHHHDGVKGLLGIKGLLFESTFDVSLTANPNVHMPLSHGCGY